MLSPPRPYTEALTSGLSACHRIQRYNYVKKRWLRQALIHTGDVLQDDVRTLRSTQQKHREDHEDTQQDGASTGHTAWRSRLLLLSLWANTFLLGEPPDGALL